MPTVLTASAASAVHILAFAVGFYGITMRATALRQTKVDTDAVLYADNVWGLATFGLIGTGLVRVFVTEKGFAWYAASTGFQLKMGLFALVFAIELFPMLKFMQWRINGWRGRDLDTRHVRLLATISSLEVFGLVALPFVAAAMARGL